ncbi:MAG: Gfo/Idh/MocA family oxidoreductase [Opitutales bacterium]|nr:Gfo/Idh/MocA family oxidoreductase [Opitutales bacterium]
MKFKKTDSSRRTFIKGAATAAFACNYVPSHVFGANSRVNVAGIGVGGKGSSDVMGADKHGAKIVALCDVDTSRGSRLIEYFTESDGKVKVYKDFRKMLEEMDKDIDAVTVSTPDHVHAPASLLAMQMGKHCYTQKPLTWSVHEARLMKELSEKKGVVTQMGNQAHAGEPIRRAVELVRAGIIGDVTEAHVMTNRPIWPQGMKKFPDKVEIPKNLDWDLWLGPAPKNDYGNGILPFNWRGWWDYGTGALGDRACHIMDLAYWSLELGAPISVEAESGGNTEVSPPNWSIVTYKFPGRCDKPPVTLKWYDGRDGNEPKVPAKELWEGVELYRKDKKGKFSGSSKYGSILVGTKGTLYFNRGNTNFVVKHQAGTVTTGEKGYLDFVKEGFKSPKQKLARTKDEDFEWINAIRNGGKLPLSNFSQSGPFSETVLLGNVAIRTGEKIEWDAKNLKAKGCPAADQFIRRKYRKGWELPV